MPDVPTSLDGLVKESRQIVARLRQVYGNPPDFDYRIKDALTSFLSVYPPATQQFTLDAIFGDD
jgi:hypothetical protein